MHKIKCPECGTEFDLDDSAYADIVAQVRSQEFSDAVAEQSALIKKQAETESAAVLSAVRQEYESKLLKKDSELDNLRQQASFDRERMLAEQKEALQKAEADKKQALFDAKQETTVLQNELDLAASKNELIVQNLKQQYEDRLKLKDEEIAYYKDFKARESTKAVGESLEQYCLTEFNKVRSAAFSTASFEKDNTVSSQSGSKGDFIFRDFFDGVEYISIMFEMKNENETTATKHKNEDFLKELDKDRREKGCEYAVLCSMLEADSDLYNQGIVDMSHRYPKMYVIRPQFLIPIITLLRNAAQQTIDTRLELKRAQQDNIDVTKFMGELDAFKDSFTYSYRLAGERFQDAVKEIDKSIASLQAVKDNLLKSSDRMNAVNNKVQDLSIKKLTKNNPGMRERFLNSGLAIDTKREAAVIEGQDVRDEE